MNVEIILFYVKIKISFKLNISLKKIFFHFTKFFQFFFNFSKVFHNFSKVILHFYKSSRTFQKTFVKLHYLNNN